MNTKVIGGIVVYGIVLIGSAMYIQKEDDNALQQDQKNVQTYNEDNMMTSKDNTNVKNMEEMNIVVVQEGVGEQKSKAGDAVVVHYIGKLTDGTKFDSSVDRGVPFEFVIGKGMVIEGWEKGMLDMKIGEKRTLTIPSDMGYGARGAGDVIPPNATLVFDVELIAIK